MSAGVARRSLTFWSFVVLMLSLTALFVVLGTWQLARLTEKEALIAAVAARQGAPPQPLPPVADWASSGFAELEYAPVSASGTFDADQTIRVFTALGDDARGAASGPGYWYVTPLRLSGGGTLLVNRGFVPEQRGVVVADPPVGEVQVTGVARASEGVSMFTPAPDVANRIEWVRNVERLAALLPADFAPVFPLTLDLPAGPRGALPQGGETVVEFPNNHLGYAITWFGFALLTPAMLGAWIWRQRRAATAH